MVFYSGKTIVQTRIKENKLLYYVISNNDNFTSLFTCYVDQDFKANMN